MISREDLEAFKARHVQARERLIANVNVAQGAIDSASALLALWDKNDAATADATEAMPNGKA